MLASKVYVNYAVPNASQIDTSTFYKEQVDKLDTGHIQSKLRVKETALFAFNPNEVDANQLQALGLSEKSARVFLNYRNIIGKFDYVEQLQKVYGISPDLYSHWLPYIQLPTKNEFLASKTAESTKPTFAHEDIEVKHPKLLEIKVIELQSADSTALEKLPGIGAYVAGKIVKFRTALGGFASLEQLKEVKGMRPENLDLFKTRIILEEPVFRKIKINTADWSTLSRHPYLDSKLSNVIIAYRKAHGNYTSITDVSKIVLMDAETLKKIEPYLEF